MSDHLISERTTLTVAGKALEVAYHRHPKAVRNILLLHEALGSISHWRHFPQQLAITTSSNVLLYSRAGHGNSKGPLAQRGDLSYRNEVQSVIPTLLEHFDIKRPVIFGHSEGAVIGILYASVNHDVASLILESPFLVASASVGERVRRTTAEYPASQLQERLAKYHLDADAVFYSWAQWAGALPDGELAFARSLSSVDCPVLVLQGPDDPFGTSEHTESLVAALPSAVRKEIIGAEHTPHREREAETLACLADFLEESQT